MIVRKIIILQLLVCLSLTCIAQTSETKYYKNNSLKEEVVQEKAKYSTTITTNIDGSVTRKTKNLKRNIIESRYSFREEEPVGSWIYLTGNGPEEIDYNFILVYSNEVCANTYNIKNYFIDDKNLGYEAPVIATGEQFIEFLAMNVFYTADAKIKNIQGTVELIFDLTSEGKIDNVRVKKGLKLDLDKEAVRVVRKIKLSSPAKINGQPQNMCGTVSITFRLA